MEEDDMSNKFNKIVALVLVFTVGILSNARVFAESYNVNHSKSNVIVECNGVILTEDGITINGVYYSKEEFEQKLNQAVLVEENTLNDREMLKTPAAAGIYFIPGIGEVALGVTGVIIVGGVAIGAATWLGRTIMRWIESRSSSKEREVPEVDIPEEDLDGIIVGLGAWDSKRADHIMDEGHEWGRLIPGGNNGPDPDRWEKIKRIIRKTLKYGRTLPYKKTALKKVLEIRGQIIEVTFVIKKGVVLVSDAWVKR